MPVRGVRGAIDVADDNPEAVLAATRELLTAILEPILSCAARISPARSSPPRMTLTPHIPLVLHAKWTGLQ
ncbi:MAG: chorismate mutase [Anaerolineales bacterium]|nr:chorismate mutase [Anaerolineales bacterium]